MSKKYTRLLNMSRNYRAKKFFINSPQMNERSISLLMITTEKY
jgi:hypothetical protein